jgi:hypothetical protein
LCAKEIPQVVATLQQDRRKFQRLNFPFRRPDQTIECGLKFLRIAGPARRFHISTLMEYESAFFP